MSGFPNNKPTDASKFRQNYLANLALETKNNEINYQANKIFKKTGQTPTQVLDTRTTTEKLADIEMLKIELRGELKEIADGIQADAIVQMLNDEELIFLAQHINEIVKQIKPKYKYGILADIFVPYLQTYMENAEETNEVINGLQQSKHILMGIEQIINGMVSHQNLENLADYIVKHNRLLNRGIEQALRRDIAELNLLIPSIEDIKHIQRISNANTRAIIQKELSLALQDLPTNSQIEALVREFNTAISQRDSQYAQEIGTQLHLLLSVEPATREQIEELKKQIEELTEHTKPSEIPATPLEQGATSAPLVEVEPAPTHQQAFIRNRYRSLEQLGNSKSAYKEYIDENFQYGKFPSLKTTYTQNTYGKAYASLNLTDLKDFAKELNRRLRIEAYGTETPIGVGEGIKGKGIQSKYQKRSITHKTDFTKGIVSNNSKYIPFGRYHIDQHRLNDNIVSIRRHTGCNIQGLPVSRISKDLGSVLRTIVGGGQPQFHQLEKLTPDEKLYLHKLAKHSNIIDRISIPTPNKDEDDKDINQFEIYKGEIMNGNDSVELVKKFKLLIMKMMKNDLLPKSQAKDILIDLVSLGY
jgi:hypothetical protein